VKLWSGATGRAAVGYSFNVPTADLYKSVKFEVLGRGSLTGGTSIQIHNWTACTDWNLSCADAGNNGPQSYGWASARTTRPGHVSGGGVVRGYAAVAGYGLAGWMDIQDVRVTVVYGVLR
jgi:hypothetical protein